jgi:hypothetical protein
VISIYKEDIFDKKFFLELQKYIVNFLETCEYVKYSESLGRYYAVIVLPNEIKDEILKFVHTTLNDDSLDIMFAQVVKYQIKDSFIPNLAYHTDGKALGTTIDISIDCNIDWPLVVDGTPLPHRPNSAVIIAGQEEVHGRDQYPSSSESDYVTLLFIHTASKDDVRIALSKRFFSKKPEEIVEYLKNTRCSVEGVY